MAYNHLRISDCDGENFETITIGMFANRFNATIVEDRIKHDLRQLELVILDTLDRFVQFGDTSLDSQPSSRRLLARCPEPITFPTHDKVLFMNGSLLIRRRIRSYSATQESRQTKLPSSLLGRYGI